jgi:phytoene synthase
MKTNGHSSPTDSSAIASANATLKAKGKSFYWACHLLGARHARNATRLYAFCRLLDDIADEAPSKIHAEERLAAIAAAVTSNTTDDACLMDALALIRDCRIDPEVVHELIKGVASDLGHVGMRTEAELLQYCYRVAGTVGLMMCNALDVTNPAALPHAVDLGIGMQLTNICRDVVEDAGQGRRYLPATLIGDVSPNDLVVPNEATRLRLRSCLEMLLHRADQHYRSGEMGIRYLPFRARAGILSAAWIYRAIGERLRASDYACWDGRAFVGARTKLLLTASALIDVCASPLASRASVRHDISLHIDLVDFTSLAKTRHAG